MRHFLASDLAPVLSHTVASPMMAAAGGEEEPPSLPPVSDVLLLNSSENPRLSKFIFLVNLVDLDFLVEESRPDIDDVDGIDGIDEDDGDVWG